jgi:coproporphyrinogen III oxidase
VAPEALSHLLAVRNLNRLVLETLEGESTFAVTPWTRPEGGGGVMSVLRGRDIEKSAVNMSLVVGDKYPSIESEYAGKPFTACGVSLICHAYNPHAPIAHMNVRILTVGQGAQAVTWIGGGGDLTPMIHYAEDTEAFHNALRQACEQHPLGDYPRFKAWCDEYFYIPHRGQTRGVGGIFFDYLRIDDPADTQFLNLVGSVFAGVYGSILAKRLDEPFSEAEKEEQLFWRGRYAEFNLVYDRGTRFGLQSGGHLDAIFGSLPPVVKW